MTGWKQPGPDLDGDTLWLKLKQIFLLLVTLHTGVACRGFWVDGQVNTVLWKQRLVNHLCFLRSAVYIILQLLVLVE